MNDLRVYTAMRDEIEELKLQLEQERRSASQDIAEIKLWAVAFMVGAFLFGLFI